MRFISTKIHGILDYLSAIALFTLPYLISGETAETARLLFYLAAGVVVYALLTRYEFGAAKLIPMPVHLIVDFALGVFLLLFAWTADGEPAAMRIALTCLGVFALGASLLTKTHSPLKAADAARSDAQTAAR